jgi:primosomal protein N''
VANDGALDLQRQLDQLGDELAAVQTDAEQLRADRTLYLERSRRLSARLREVKDSRDKWRERAMKLWRVS